MSDCEATVILFAIGQICGALLYLLTLVTIDRVRMRRIRKQIRADRAEFDAFRAERDRIDASAERRLSEFMSVNPSERCEARGAK